MLQAFVISFVQAWLLGLVALVIGRYIGKRQKQLPYLISSKLFLYLKVWSVTFIAQVAFAYLGYFLGFNESFQIGLAETLLPLMAGSYYAHTLFLRLTD